jgi:uncharacterized protein involved in exopolysaccharide biosynthesis
MTVRYAIEDYPGLLRRELGLMVVVFLVVLALGLGFALTLKTVYPAQSSLLVRLGPEYVYQPRVGDAARGAIPEADQVIQSEVEILSSAQVREQVIARIGLARLFPKLGERFAGASPAERRELTGKAVAAMGKALKIATTPGAPVVRLTYSNADPQIAALALNTLVDEYLAYRRTIFLDPTAPLDDQRKAFQTRLAEADEAYESFLGSNNIGDFEAEKTSLAQLQASLAQQKLTADAGLEERRGRLTALSTQAAQVNQEVGLYRDVDHAAQDKLTDLKLQRANLLGRYRPDAEPVRDIEAQIETLQRAIAGGGVQGEGARRVGINPVYQTVQTDQIQLAGEIGALQSSSEALAGQIAQVTERQLRLARLEPQYQGLARDRDVLSTNVRDFTVKEQASQAAGAIARQSNDNISIVERAVAPTEGTSLKKPVAVLSLLLAAFTALCAGLLSAMLRPGPPSRAATSRMIGLPILATAPLKSPVGA